MSTKVGKHDNYSSRIDISLRGSELHQQTFRFINVESFVNLLSSFCLNDTLVETNDLDIFAIFVRDNMTEFKVPVNISKLMKLTKSQDSTTYYIC